MSDKANFEELLTFPCMFVFRAVGRADSVVQAACVSCVERLLDRRVMDVTVKPSAQGRWRSMRIRVAVLSGDEIRAVYAALNEVDGVRMVL